MREASIGERVTGIGGYAFSGCAAMAELRAGPSVPPACGARAFDGIDKRSCKLYVPEGAADGYRAAGQRKESFFVESRDFADLGGQPGGVRVVNGREVPVQ